MKNKKFDVTGTAVVVIHCTVEVEVDNDGNDDITNKAIKKAKKIFGGIHGYTGNGGSDKLIGVDGSNEAIYFDENDDDVRFDDAMEINY